MTDLERRLQDALRSVGETYRPVDPDEARARFVARRRKRAVGLYAGAAVLAAAAAVAFVVFGAQDVAREPGDRELLPVVGPSLDAVVTDMVDVGDAPSGLGSGGGYIWVANSGDDTVSQIDSTTNEVVQSFAVPGGPDDVLVTGDYAAWVATEEGAISFIDAAAGTTTKAWQFEPGTHVDLAPTEDGQIWAVGGSELVKLTANSDTVLTPPELGRDLADVATYGDDTWVYSRADGRVLQVDLAGRTLSDTEVGVSQSADLLVTSQWVWIYLSEGGRLVQISRDSGDLVSEIPLGGTFGAVAEEGGVLYVMVTEGGVNGSGDGLLYRIDSNSAERLGNPVPLSDSPYDVEAGPEGIWVTNHSGDTITRVELVPRDEAPPDAEPPAIAGELLFYFARDGDIFSYDSNGNVAPVIASKAVETSPSLGPDEATFVYQEVPPGSQKSTVAVYGFLADDDIYPIDKGESPAFSRQGRIAWTWLNDAGRRIVSVGTPGTDDRVDFEPDPEWALGPALVENIEWDEAGDTIFFESSYEETILYSADVGPEAEPLASVIPPNENGAVYLSPAVHPDGTVTVVRLCCGIYPEFDFTVAELGYLEGDRYSKISGLDDLGFAPSFDLWIEPAGNLAYETETGWTVADERSWLIGDGDRLGLISETGEFDAIDLSGVTDATVVPGPHD